MEFAVRKRNGVEAWKGDTCAAQPSVRRALLSVVTLQTSSASNKSETPHCGLQSPAHTPSLAVLPSDLSQGSLPALGRM